MPQCHTDHSAWTASQPTRRKPPSRQSFLSGDLKYVRTPGDRRPRVRAALFLIVSCLGGPRSQSGRHEHLSIGVVSAIFSRSAVHFSATHWPVVE